MFDQQSEFNKVSESLRRKVSLTSVEFRLILFILRQDTEDESTEALGSDFCRAIDWDLFVDLIVRHRVGPLIHLKLSKLNHSLVPKHIRHRIRQRWYRSNLTSLVFAGELISLLRFFRGKQLKVLPIKGLCLSQQIYGTWEAREPGDIDLLVDDENLETVDNHLAMRGYRNKWIDFGLSPLRKKRFKEWTHSTEYTRQSGHTPIDLHWRLFVHRSLLPISFTTLWTDSIAVDLSSEKVQTLCLEHALLLSLVHGAFQGWSHLLWVSDVAQILKKKPQIDWQRLITDFNSLGTTRILVLGLVLANGLLGSPIPAEVRQYIERQPSLPGLVDHCLESLNEREPTPYSLAENIKLIRYRLKLSAKLRYKWEMLWNMRIHPPDWKTCPIPDTFFTLYYIVRPILWLLRRIQRRALTKVMPQRKD